MSTIKVYALRSFTYCADGYTGIPVKRYETFDLPEHLFEGLNDIRYVRRAEIGDGGTRIDSVVPNTEEARFEAVADTAIELREVLTDLSEAKKPETARLRTAEPRSEQLAVEIPDDWKDLKWFAIRSLAAKVSNNPIKTMEDAVAAIEAELARRG